MDNVHTVDKERIRMELYTATYLEWVSQNRNYHGNVAEAESVKAVEAFDRFFMAKE